MLEHKNLKCFSNFELKIIAMISMLVDHIGAVFFPEFTLLRVIGRLSFPIFAFLIVEGFFHTHDLRKYEIRLFLFALLSEIPFDLAFYQKIFYPGHQNVFFTLALGLILLDVLQREKLNISLKALICIAIYLSAWFLQTDYSIVGITFILIFYLFHQQNFEKLIFFSAANLFSYGIVSVQCAAVLACIPIGLYNGKKGRNLRWLFYLFYPVHLMLLFLIKRWVS